MLKCRLLPVSCLLQILYLKVNGVVDPRYNQLSNSPRESQMMFSALNTVGVDAAGLEVYEDCIVSPLISFKSQKVASLSMFTFSGHQRRWARIGRGELRQFSVN